MARPKLGLDALLASKEMVLVTGSGGVGKTTVAAALGLSAAVHLGGRILVLTVDPARHRRSRRFQDAFERPTTRA